MKLSLIYNPFCQLDFDEFFSCLIVESTIITYISAANNIEISRRCEISTLIFFLTYGRISLPLVFSSIITETLTNIPSNFSQLFHS